MLRFRVYAAVGLLLGVSGCAGANQRMFTQSTPRDGAVRSPFLSRANRNSAQFPVVASEAPAGEDRRASTPGYAYPSMNPRGAAANATAEDSGNRAPSRYSSRPMTSGRMGQQDQADEPSSELPLSLNIDVPADGPRTRVADPNEMTQQSPRSAVEGASELARVAVERTAPTDTAVVMTAVEEVNLPGPVEMVSANSAASSPAGAAAEYAPPPPTLAQAPGTRSQADSALPPPSLPEPSTPGTVVQQGTPMPVSAQYVVDSGYLASGQTMGCGACSKCGKKPCFLKTMFQKPCCLSGLFQKPCFLTKCFQKPCFLTKCFQKKACLASPQAMPSAQVMPSVQCAPAPVCTPKKCFLPPTPSKQMPMAQGNYVPSPEPPLISTSKRSSVVTWFRGTPSTPTPAPAVVAEQPRPVFNRMWTASIDPSYATARPVSINPVLEPEPAPAPRPRRSLLARLWNRGQAEVNPMVYSIPAPPYAGAPAPPTVAAVSPDRSVAPEPSNLTQQGQTDERVTPSSFSETTER